MIRMRSERLFNKLESLFKNLNRASLVTADHEILYLKYHSLTDIGTLQQCAEVAHNYLHLQDGDIVLTNDPYSGGTLLSSPSLVLGVGNKFFKGQNPAEFLITSRLNLTPRVGPFKNLDEEGLRIPPSPFYIKGIFNSPLVEALKSHPLTPPEFIDSIAQEAEKLLQFRTDFKNNLSSGQLDLSRSHIKEYLQTTTDQFLNRLEDVGEGSTELEYSVSSKETIKLKIEHIDGFFNFDFTGTTPGERMFLTDTATFGVVVGSTLSLLQENIPINSGILRRFDVKTPRGCLLNATFPRSIFLGHTDGLNILANLISRGFSNIHKKLNWAPSGPSYCSYELVFRDGRVFYDSLATGIGATEKSAGLNGAFAWRKNFEPCSLEIWESEYPLQLVQSGFRSNSGGDGKNTGGHGVSRTIQILEDAELKWNYLSPLHQPEGVDGGKSALGPEIVVKKKDGSEYEKLPQWGSLALVKGDTITVLTSGGGGYGASGK